jgi:hypothetical protein
MARCHMDLESQLTWRRFVARKRWFSPLRYMLAARPGPLYVRPRTDAYRAGADHAASK